MEVVHLRLGSQIEKIENLTLALGLFDGFHLGHEELCIKAVMAAEGPAGILLFSEPPARYIQNGKSNDVLMDVEDKIAYARKLRFDYAFVVETNEEFYSLTPRKFIERIILPLGTTLAVAGEDFKFGLEAMGDIHLLKEYVSVFEVPLLYLKRDKVSSSSIKNMIRCGDIDDAYDYLGHPYEVKGRIVKGLGKATELGFPTLNVSLNADYVLPKSGVYAGFTYVQGIPYKSMIYVGKAPTIRNDNKIQIESHCFGLKDDDYTGGFVFISFLAFAREEEKFDSVSLLMDQIKKDKDDVLALLEDFE